MNEDLPKQCGESPDALFKILIGTLGVTSVCILGIIGNTLTAIVLLQKSMRSSVNTILLGLSISDLIFVLVSLIFYGISQIFEFFCIMLEYNKVFLPLLVPNLFPLLTVAQLASVYFTVAVTVERFIVVYYPLRAKSFCTVKHAIFASILIAMFSIIYNLPTIHGKVPMDIVNVQPLALGLPCMLPTWWEYTYKETFVNGTFTGYELEYLPLREDKHYVLYYVNWGSFFIYRFFPFFTLLILNVLIFKKIREANKFRKTITTSQTSQAEFKIAKMLVIVIGTFLLCNILALVLNMRESFSGSKNSDEIIMLSSFLITLNSSVNFIIYCFMANKFRKVCIDLFLPCYATLKRKNNGRNDTFTSDLTNSSHNSNSTTVM